MCIFIHPLLLSVTNIWTSFVGAVAKDFFTKSKLPIPELSHIWWVLTHTLSLFEPKKKKTVPDCILLFKVQTFHSEPHWSIVYTPFYSPAQFVQIHTVILMFPTYFFQGSWVMWTEMELSLSPSSAQPSTWLWRVRMATRCRRACLRPCGWGLWSRRRTSQTLPK